MRNLIGHTGQIEIYSDANNQMKVDVVISDVKQSYGNTLLLCKPLSGSGQMWKRSDNVTNIRAEQPVFSDDEFDTLMEVQ